MSQMVGKRAAQTVFDGSYELLAPIGRGSDSITYCARPLFDNPASNQTANTLQAKQGGRSTIGSPAADGLHRSELDIPDIIALKVISDNGQVTPELIDRTKREAAALAAIDHPNVIKLYECRANERGCFLALEYARHGNLSSILEQYAEPLAPDRALKLTTQLLNGIEAIHRAGIIHRDIKPENILVPNRSSIKISDFGIALLPTERHFSQSSVRPVGTLDYAAPEFLMYGEVSETSDLYAIAVTLFQFLTRNLPFEGNTFSKQLNRKISGIRTPLAQFVSYDTALLEKLFDKSLSPDRSRRFQTAREFRHAIETLLGANLLPNAGSTRAYNASNYQSLTNSTAPRAASSMPSSLRLEGQISPPQGRRGDEQLAKLRTKRERTKTQHIELAAFERRLGRKRSRFTKSRIAIGASLFGLFAALTIGLQLFTTKEHAVASLVQPQEMSIGQLLRSLPQGLRELFFDDSVTPFSTAKALASGTHTGFLKNFLADEQHIPFAIHGLGTDNRFVIALGIPGWKPRVIALSSGTQSSEIRIEGHGLNISLWIRPSGKDSLTVEGTYLERSSNRKGSWIIYRSAPIGSEASTTIATS